jgi:hypothetical protein
MIIVAKDELKMSLRSQSIITRNGESFHRCGTGVISKHCPFGIEAESERVLYKAGKNKTALQHEDSSQ